MSGKWIRILAIALGAAALVLGAAAWAGVAADSDGSESLGRRLGKVLYGELLSADSGSMTVRPEIPPKLKERAAARGIELPELPPSVSVQLDGDSRLWLDGEKAAPEDFAAGEKVVLKLDGSWREAGASVQRGADAETARQQIQARFADSGECAAEGEGGRGRGKHAGEGRSKRGHGGPGGHGPRVAFGEVIAVSGDSITIKPEVPDFLQQMHEQRQKEREERRASRGGEGRGPGGNEGDGPQGPQGPHELPEELSFSLNQDTVFVVNESEQNSNPFKVGDRVGILPAPPQGGHGRHGGSPGNDGAGSAGPGMDGPPRGDGQRMAGIVSDYASAEARMKERQEKRQERRREGKSGRKGKGPRGGNGGQDAVAGGEG